MKLALRALVSLLVTVASVLVSPAGPVDAADAVLDANTLPPTSATAGVVLAEGFPLAQTFRARHDAAVAHVDLGLSRSGTRELLGVRVELREAGPSGPGALLASAVISPADLGSKPEGMVQATFDGSPALTAGASYALVVEPLGCCAWLRYESPVGRYTDGMLLYRSGGAWLPWIAVAPGATDALFAVYVRTVDDVPPVITTPGTLEAELTDPAGAVLIWSATAVDDVDGPVPVACSPHAGWTFPFGTTGVRCAASDAAGNVAEASFEVRVVDTTPPVVGFDGRAAYGVHETIVLACTASDSGSGVRQTSCDEPYVADAWVLGLGAHDVAAHAVDVAGNRIDVSTTFVVEVDEGSLAALTHRLVANPGVAQSLAVKLERGQLDGFRRQLRALSPRHVSAEDAQLLLDLATHLA